MNAWIAWIARNPVAANLLMIFLVVAGLIGTETVQKEVFPEIDLSRIQVEVRYPGAAPEEVEEAVVIRVERAVQGIEGVKEVRSTASEGKASVLLELELGAEAQEVIQEVTSNLNAITTFPDESDEPVIRQLLARQAVVDLAIAGTTDTTTLKMIAERVRDELSALPEITQVEIIGAPPYEIAIEVSEQMLRQHGLTLDHVATSVRRSSVDVPGGLLRTDVSDIQLRTLGQAYNSSEYEQIAILTRPDGSHLRVDDVATVVDGVAEANQRSSFDGTPAVMLSVFRTGSQDALEISDAVRRYVERTQPGMPEGIALTIWQDQAEQLRDRLALMLRNGWSGFLLVFAVLALALDLRVACWVSLGIPVSFLGAVALMPGINVSVNVISLFAFILVLGILVDDAIIVGEGVYGSQQKHKDGLRGAVEGTQEIAKPLVFAVLTSIAAFLPMLLVPGPIGKVFRVIPLVAIPCMLLSLVESLGILPAHLAHRSARRAPSTWRRLQIRIVERIESFLRSVYEPLLEMALHWRYVTAAVAISILLLSGALVGGGVIAFRFLPSIEADFMSAAFTMPQGTPIELTATTAAKLEEGAASLKRRLSGDTGKDHFRHVSTTVGDQPIRARGAVPTVAVRDYAASNVAEVTVELAPAETRDYTSEQLSDMWREESGPMQEAVAVDFKASILELGDDVDVQLTGPSLSQLRAAAEALKLRLLEYEGVYNVSDSFRAGASEIRIGIQADAEALGLTVHDLGHQVRQAFHGEEIQRIQRGREEVRVIVRYPPDERRSIADLRHMPIRASDGQEVPFHQVAEITQGLGVARITRIDGKRAVNLTALVDPSVSSSDALISDLREDVLPQVLSNYADVSYSFAGVEAAQIEAVGGLRRGFILALFLIFALLAVPLRSYLQPLIIMSAIPFGFVGAILGHLLMGIDITLMSMFGLVALAGVVVNDSLVMVDFINRRRLQKSPNGTDGIERAVREAGSLRLRPILLTSVTTFMGLAPLMFEKSLQGAFLVPMAVSLAFGVWFATSITLILVPVGYLILNDVQWVLRRLFGRSESRRTHNEGHRTVGSHLP